MEKANQVRKFDLNIEKILEDWEVYHEVREVIANTIDEQVLTKTKGIEIFKDEEGKWHIVLFLSTPIPVHYPFYNSSATWV